LADITVANTDWAILAAVRDALAGATVSGEAVFKSVSVASAGRDAARGLTASPAAVVRFVGSREAPGLDGERLGAVDLELVLAARVDGSDGRAARLEEILRLKNAAVNAVRTSPPADAVAVGDGRFSAEALAWGRPEIDADARPPWVVVTLTLRAGYRLADAVSH